MEGQDGVELKRNKGNRRNETVAEKKNGRERNCREIEGDRTSVRNRW